MVNRNYNMMSLSNLSISSLETTLTQNNLPVDQKVEGIESSHLTHAQKAETIITLINVDHRVTYDLIRFIRSSYDIRMYNLLNDFIINNKLYELEIIFKYYPSYANSVGSINPHRMVPSTPLIESCKWGYYEIINLIFDKLTYDNKVFIDSRGNTALYYALRTGSMTIISKLIHDGSIDINLQNNCGKTPLIIASVHRYRDVIKLLLRAGADPYIKDNSGNTAIDYSPQLMDTLMFQNNINMIGLDVVDFG